MDDILKDIADTRLEGPEKVVNLAVCPACKKKNKYKFSWYLTTVIPFPYPSTQTCFGCSLCYHRGEDVYWHRVAAEAWDSRTV